MEDGRKVEITADLVLHAGATLSDNKVNGPQDAVLSEMIKTLPLEKIYTITRCFQERFMGAMEVPNSWKIVNFVFFRELDAEPKKEIRSYRAKALTSVMSKWYASCVVMLMERERASTRIVEQALVGGINNISCQHLQVMLTNLLQKHWELQEHRGTMMIHGCVVRPTMFLASLDIKTAFDEARPRQHPCDGGTFYVKCLDLKGGRRSNAWRAR